MDTLTRTFSLDEAAAARAFFHANGYAAFREVLSVEECLETCEAINSLMKQMEPAFDLFDANTYDHAPINPNYGVVSRGPIFSQRFLLNRQHPNVYRAFATLHEDPHLLVSHDRCAFYRPTRNVRLATGVSDRPNWRTEYSYPGVHLDFNPGVYHAPDKVLWVREALRYDDLQAWISENNLYCHTDGAHLQAVLTLEDNRLEDGGFHCVPGFHTHFEEWLAGFSPEADGPAGLYRFSPRSANDCRFISSPVRVPVPAGSLIIWDQRLAHGTLPNESERMRLIQFMKVFPRRIVTKERYQARGAALTAILAECGFHEITDVGRSVFGLEGL